MDDLADYVAIKRLQSAYGDAVTRGAWDEVAPMFAPDCRVRLDLQGGTVHEFVGGREVSAFIATSVERFEFFVFTILNSVVDIDATGSDASGRLYIQELRQEREGHRWSTAIGLYRDRYRRSDGGWRFARRDYTSLARTVASEQMDVFPIP